MILIIPYSHYYRVGGPHNLDYAHPKALLDSYTIQAPSSEEVRTWKFHFAKHKVVSIM